MTTLVKPEHATETAARLPETSHSGDTTAALPESAPSPDAPTFGPPVAPGELGRLGHYRVLSVLGRGGMGAIYLATDETLGREVALKVMLPEAAAVPTARERFLREARAAAGIAHDNVVAIHHVGDESGVPYIVMPLLKGETLADRLKRDGHLTAAESLRVGREVALGLAAAHARGLVHRDVKPANIWLEAVTGRVKVLDFGLARPDDSDRQHLTQSGTVMGTPAYMAPEQAAGDPVDHRADLFSLGCVLYEASTGTRPFAGTTVMAMLTKIATHTPPPASTIADVPLALSDLIARLLAKQPAGRPQSAAGVAELLRCPGGPESAVATTFAPAPPRKPRRRAWVAAGLAGALAAAFAGAIVVKIKRDDGRETTVEVPDGAVAKIDPQGNVEVTLAKAAAPTKPVAPAKPAGPPVRRLARVVDGDWKVVGKELIQRSTATAHLWFGDEEWADYDVSVEARTDSGREGPSLYFRAEGLGNYYGLQIGGYNATWHELNKHARGHWSRDVAPTPMKYEVGRWYRMAASVRKDRLKCTLDGELVYDHRDADYPRGRVGLRTWDAAARFRDLRVTDPAGAVLWEGPPDLPPDH